MSLERLMREERDHVDGQLTILAGHQPQLATIETTFDFLQIRAELQRVLLPLLSHNLESVLRQDDTFR